MFCFSVCVSSPSRGQEFWWTALPATELLSFFFSLVNTQLRSRAIVIVMHFFFLFVFLLSTDEK